MNTSVSRLTNARDPVTAYLPLHASLIGEAEDDQSVRLTTMHATGYLQALYDIAKIDAAIFERWQHLIEWMRSNRENELAGLPLQPWPGSPQ